MCCRHGSPIGVIIIKRQVHTTHCAFNDKVAKGMHSTFALYENKLVWHHRSCDQETRIKARKLAKYGGTLFVNLHLEKLFAYFFDTSLYMHIH